MNINFDKFQASPIHVFYLAITDHRWHTPCIIEVFVNADLNFGAGLWPVESVLLLGLDNEDYALCYDTELGPKES